MKNVVRGLAYILLLAAIVSLAVCVDRYKRSLYAEAVANEIERREQKEKLK